jgi:hypothetical protein
VNKPKNTETKKKTLSPKLVTLTGAALAALALLVYLLWPASDKVSTDTGSTDATDNKPASVVEPPPAGTVALPLPALQPQPAKPIPATKPPTEPTVSVPSITTLPLPPLDNSDDYARDELDDAFASSNIDQWLPENDLIRRFVIFVNSLSEANLIRGQLEHLPIRGKFNAIETRPKHYRLDPESYHRYDAITDFFTSLDGREIVRLYQENSSLITKAYRELGNPQTDFNKVFIRAIDEVMATPELEGDIELVRPSVTYRFEDKQLEQLSKVQKQLIRMGPENTRKIKAKLREIRSALR